MENTEFLSLKEAGAILGVSQTTLWKWMKEGKIIPTRLSKKKVYIEKEELNRFIKDSKGKEYLNPKD